MQRGYKKTLPYSSGSGAAGAAAAAALSPGGGCNAGTAFEDLAGVDVGDTLFVGDPWKKDREAPFQRRIRLEILSRNKDYIKHVSYLCWRPERAEEEKEP